MPEPCRQEVPIAKLEAANKTKDSILLSLQQTLQENTRLLGTMAEIGADIRHLRDDKDRQQRDIDTLFDRMRVMEMLPGEAMSKVGLIMLSAGSSAFGALAVGLVLWILKGG